MPRHALPDQMTAREDCFGSPEHGAGDGRLVRMHAETGDEAARQEILVDLAGLEKGQQLQQAGRLRGLLVEDGLGLAVQVGQ